jgi:hypothetical protein
MAKETLEELAERYVETTRAQAEAEAALISALWVEIAGGAYHFDLSQQTGLPHETIMVLLEPDIAEVSRFGR